MSGIRVRFAPSPTGYLHVGGARTALFNWLFARNKGGVFVLRIEDTDIERSSEEMVTSILDSMRWLGMDWDEGPCFQSEGLDRHRQIAMELMDRGKAYPCFCLPDELKKSDAYLYPRNCLEVDPEERRSRIAAGEPYALRFHVPAGYTEFTDLVYGSIKIDHENIDDFVLLRRDHSCHTRR
jgi:glutamyl-tRNA synthetase